ncbi:hypothetical protein K8R30_01030 [archaeon]|nr:hypothetical protein [archaeon]
MVKEKKLRLRPSARDKRRYFLVRASNERVEKAILDYVGVLGFSKSAYRKVVTKDFSGKLVGSCLVKSLDEVRAALALAGIRVERVSGTLKGLKAKA